MIDFPPRYIWHPYKQFPLWKLTN